MWQAAEHSLWRIFPQLSLKQKHRQRNKPKCCTHQPVVSWAVKYGDELVEPETRSAEWKNVDSQRLQPQQSELPHQGHTSGFMALCCDFRQKHGDWSSCKWLWLICLNDWHWINWNQINLKQIWMWIERCRDNHSRCTVCILQFILSVS